jgi:hypothetical protein
MQENIQIKSISLYDFGQKLFWIFSVLIVATLVFYVYAIQSTIVHIVDRTTNEAAVRATGSDIAELEADLTALGSSMDLNFAKESGYREISKINYVSRSAVLTMRD